MEFGLGWRSGSAARCGLCAVAAGVAVAVAGAGVASAAPGETTLVSRATGAGGVAGNARSEFPALSADGRTVAFASLSTNLTRDDRDGREDIFVRDVVANTTILVSRASGTAGVKGNGRSDDAAISGDGSRVAFASRASDLTRSDRDRSPDVFVRDLRSGTTTLVSRAGGRAGPKANARASQPAISADGRFVAFVSRASNLTSADHDHRVDVFVRDLQAHTTTLVNRDNGRAGRKCGMTLPIATPAISADGRFVAFACSGSGGDQQIFVRDLRRQATALVSRAGGIAGPLGESDSYAPAISAEGRIVAFQSQATNLTQDTLSSAGALNVFIRDLDAATTTLASRATGPAGATGNNRVLLRPALSADGRLVAFTSSAALTPDDLDDNTDVLIRDQAAATTTLISRATGSEGAKADGPSGDPAMSADGRFVAFDSLATNLTSDSPNGGVFVRELNAPT